MYRHAQRSMNVRISQRTFDGTWSGSRPAVCRLGGQLLALSHNRDRFAKHFAKMQDYCRSAQVKVPRFLRPCLRGEVSFSFVGAGVWTLWTHTLSRSNS